MTIAAETWQAANQAALLAALHPVHAALCRAAGRDAPEPPAATPAGPEMPSALEALCTLFRLSGFERDLLLLCAGVELDGRFAEACAAAQRDERAGRATFGLALAALPGAHWSALTRDRPLRRWRLIELLPGDTLVASPLRIDERILHFLTGIDSSDERLDGVVQPIAAGEMPSWLVGTVAAASRCIAGGSAILLAGRSAADRATVAAAALETVGLRAYRLNATDLPALPGDRDTLIRHWNREAMLVAGGLYIQAEPRGDLARLPPGLLARLQSPVILDETDTGGTEPPALRIALPEPSAAERRREWAAGLGPAAAGLNGALTAIADQFRLDRPAIRAVGAALRDASSAEAAASGPAAGDPADLARAAWRLCRDHAGRSMAELARRIEPKAAWDDLILPEAQKRVLRQIAIHMRHRATVHEDWGFAGRYASGMGLTALFSGASGTGKTMAAEVLARTLDLDLHQIDLAGLVSKYIGETEKNLKRVFDAAEDGGAILLFDEADALFGKRSEVRDSHDRYANLEVSYLLQRMEAYRGLAILTTNMRHAIDAAFLRRLRFVVEFPFPDAADRARIWRRVFPDATPTAGLDPDRLARLNVPGGVIRAIAMQAAFLAAEAAQPVGMAQVAAAAEIEFGKLERPLGSVGRSLWD